MPEEGCLDVESSIAVAATWESCYDETELVIRVPASQLPRVLRPAENEPSNEGAPALGTPLPQIEAPVPADPTQAKIVMAVREVWAELFLTGQRRAGYHEAVADEALFHWAPLQHEDVPIGSLFEENTMGEKEVIEQATRELWLTRLAEGMKRIEVGQGTSKHGWQWVGTGPYEKWVNSILSKCRRHGGLLEAFEPPISTRNAE